MKNKLDIEGAIQRLEIAVKNYPMKALAAEIGKRYTTLSNEFSDQPGYKLGLITALQVLEVTGDLGALDMIEDAFGRVAFEIPAPEKNIFPVMLLIGKLAKEFGEQMQEGAQALSDGVVSQKEADRWLKELGDVIKAYLERYVND